MIRVNPKLFSGSFMILDENSVTGYMSERNANEYVDFYLCQETIDLNKVFAIIAKKRSLEAFGDDVDIAISSYEEDVVDFTGEYWPSSWAKVSKYMKQYQYKSHDEVIFPFISSIESEKCKVMSEGNDAFIVFWKGSTLVVFGGYYKGH